MQDHVSIELMHLILQFLLIPMTIHVPFPAQEQARLLPTFNQRFQMVKLLALRTDCETSIVEKCS